MSQIPALLLAGGKDKEVPPNQVEAVFTRGRMLGAPWTFGLDLESPHGDAHRHFLL